MIQDEFSEFVSSLGEHFTPSEETTSRVIDIIRSGVKEYVESRNLQSLVIKLHGDLQSTVVAALCQEKYIGVPLIGIVIAIGESSTNARRIAKKYCTAYHKLQLSRDFKNNMAFLLHDVESSFNEYIDSTIETKTEYPIYIISSVLFNIARKTNGIMLGDKTWTDTYATFSANIYNKQTYYPIQFINRGFELPEIAKQLQISSSIIEGKESEELIYGGIYPEIDVIINDLLGNLDDNLSTQVGRFKNLERFQRILLRFELNNRLEDNSITRFTLGLPTEYEY